MCGITGILALNEKGKKSFPYLDNAIDSLKSRGPDSNGKYTHNNCALGHTRLSIIDTSDAASQPFTDASGRYTIVYNGEVYNFKEHKEVLKHKGFKFRSNSDTEVILYMYIFYGFSFLEKLNGCFALAIYDKEEESLFLSRDRMGINPLHIYRDKDKLIFASEMKAIMAFDDIDKTIDTASLFSYLHLNYIPSNSSMLSRVKKLEPGTFLYITEGKEKTQHFYRLNQGAISTKTPSYQEAQEKLRVLMERSVQRRLISDVPLGAFLSGGIDSSVITAIASKFTPHMKTFSIGYKDEPYFDETRYANLVAKKFNTEHTVFSLSNDDLYEVLFDVLDYFDEPFADSSALAVYILSKKTRQKVIVALSGDGADELFSGYNKHHAELLARENSLINKLVKTGLPLWNILPKSRNNKITDKIRQLHRYAEGLKLGDRERYWRWAGYTNHKQIEQLLAINYDKKTFNTRKNLVLENIQNTNGINDVLFTDLSLVLPGDMLTKADLMSMANSLEVRVPFLDHEVVDFVTGLPSEYKINKNSRKRLLKDTYKNILPPELYNRPKHGFEVPLLKWMRAGLQEKIQEDILSKEFIEDQGIFDFKTLQQLNKKLFSNDPGDVHARLWGLIVFQHWYKKFLT